MMRSKARFSLLLVGLFLILTQTVVYADSYHYRNILVGERASGMGGAYTAVSDDPSGLYYNPAGTAYSQGSNISASANAYHYTIKEYKGVLGGNGWTREASALLPNFFGVTQTMGPGKIGLSYVVPDSIIEDQDQRFGPLASTIDLDGDGLNNVIDTYLINFNNEDNTYKFGPSYGMEVADGLSLGATVYLHYRRAQHILNEFIEFDTGQAIWSNQYFESNEFGYNPILGLMWSPFERASIGLSVSRTFIFHSETEKQVIQKDVFSSIPVDDIRSSSAKRELPYITTLGLAYFPSSSLLLSGDLSYHSSVEDEIDGKRDAVVNAAFGAEYYPMAQVALRGGLFTNFTSSPEIKSGRAGQAEHVDLYGGSLSVSYFGRGSSLSLGGAYSTGSGEAQVIGGSSNIQDLDAESWTVFLSTSYSY